MSPSWTSSSPRLLLSFFVVGIVATVLSGEAAAMNVPGKEMQGEAVKKQCSIPILGQAEVKAKDSSSALTTLASPLNASKLGNSDYVTCNTVVEYYESSHAIRPSPLLVVGVFWSKLEDLDRHSRSQVKSGTLDNLCCQSRISRINDPEKSWGRIVIEMHWIWIPL